MRDKELTSWQDHFFSFSFYFHLTQVGSRVSLFASAASLAHSTTNSGTERFFSFFVPLFDDSNCTCWSRPGGQVRELGTEKLELSLNQHQLIARCRTRRRDSERLPEAKLLKGSSLTYLSFQSSWTQLDWIEPNWTEPNWSQANGLNWTTVTHVGALCWIAFVDLNYILPPSSSSQFISLQDWKNWMDRGYLGRWKSTSCEWAQNLYLQWSPLDTEMLPIRYKTMLISISCELATSLSSSATQKRTNSRRESIKGSKIDIKYVDEKKSGLRRHKNNNYNSLLLH